MRKEAPAIAFVSKTLYWLAPAMVREGLIANNHWIPNACVRAISLFAEEDLHLPATVLAAVDEGALDYISQAPVLVVAAAYKADFKRAKDRREAAGRFKGACRQHPRLRDLLREYELSPQLRALSGQALRRAHLPLLKLLSTIDPSPLAQVIPRTPADQRHWLDALHSLRAHMRLHGGDTDWFIAWAAVRIREPAAMRASVELADFARNSGSRFDRDWSFLQARAACERWHEDTARRAIESRYTPAQLAEVADYGQLPLEITLHGHDFIALRTRPAIFEEGARMHHCVATYAETVFARRCWLYSVRRDGQRIATLELRVAAPPGAVPRFIVNQLKGPFNRVPAPQVHVAATALLQCATGAAPPLLPPPEPPPMPRLHIRHRRGPDHPAQREQLLCRLRQMLAGMHA